MSDKADAANLRLKITAVVSIIGFVIALTVAATTLKNRNDYLWETQVKLNNQFSSSVEAQGKQIQEVTTTLTNFKDELRQWLSASKKPGDSVDSRDTGLLNRKPPGI